MSVLKFRSGSTWKNMCDLVFPVGSIHLSSKNTSPAGFVGGTWATLNEQRFLMPNNAWNTGGSSTITINNMPSHNHDIQLKLMKYGNNNAAGHSSYWTKEQETGPHYTTNTGGGKHIGSPIASVTDSTEPRNIYFSKVA